MTNTRRMVVGVFDGPNHAEQALNGLKNHGFTSEQVSVVAQDKRDVQQMADNTDMAGGEGAAAGAVTGVSRPRTRTRPPSASASTSTDSPRTFMTVAAVLRSCTSSGVQ